MTLLDWGILLAGVLLLGVALLVSSLAALWTLGRFRDWRTRRRHVLEVGERFGLLAPPTAAEIDPAALLPRGDLLPKGWSVDPLPILGTPTAYDGSSQVSHGGDRCPDCEYVEMPTMCDPAPGHVLDRPCRKHAPSERPVVDVFTPYGHRLAYNAARHRYVQTGNDADLEDMLTHVTTED